MTEPRTEAGRAALSELVSDGWDEALSLRMILAIEAEAATPAVTEDGLGAALAHVEHAAGCNDPETVEWASRRGYQYGHDEAAHLPATTRKAAAILAALHLPTPDPSETKP